MSHRGIIVTEIDQTSGKGPALVSPEAACLISMKHIEHFDTPLDISDAVFGGKRNYF
jgi:hypothetical protein